jgi:hypothetical protein
MTASIALLFNRRFFLTDDYATQFAPMFKEISRQLHAGDFPLLTDRLWNGGAILQEYQYAVLNPFSLALYYIIGPIKDSAAQAAIFSLFHIFVLASGAYCLMRELGGRVQYALLASVVAPTSGWLFYWGATNWIPALVSMAWLVWTWAFLLRAYRRPRWAPAAACGTALTLLSGWPFANLALLISVLVAAGFLFDRRRQVGTNHVIRLLLCLMAGALLAMPAILPLKLYLNYTLRPFELGTWASDLPSLIGVGLPFFSTKWTTFDGSIRQVFYPMIYVSWFIPVCVANLKRDDRQQSNIRALICMSIAFGTLSMLPGIWQFRWMFRLLPYYQFSLLALSVICLSRGSAWATRTTLIVIAVEVWLAICQSPQFATAYLIIGACITLLSFRTIPFTSKGGAHLPVILITTHIAIFLLVLLKTLDTGYPLYPNAWSPPENEYASGESARSPTRYAIFDPLTPKDPGQQYWKAFGPGNTSLLRPGTSILGYSPFHINAFAQHFCFEHLGAAVCDRSVERVTTPQRPTGESLLDLMSVDEIAIQHSTDADKFRRATNGGWKEQRGAVGEWRFTRTAPRGLITWTSPLTSAVPVSHSTRKIKISADNPSRNTGKIVVARAWYPGWRARLDGKPLSVTPLSGILVSVDIPAQSRGLVTLNFWPAGLTEGLILAFLGLGLLIGLALSSGKTSWRAGN